MLQKIKKYFLLVIGLVAGIVAILAKLSNSGGNAKRVNDLRDEYDQKEEKIRDKYDSLMRERERQLEQKHQRTHKEVEEEFKEDMIKVDVAKKKTIEKLLDLHDDDQDLIKEIESTFGVSYDKKGNKSEE